jgi:hypothetical protein
VLLVVHNDLFPIAFVPVVLCLYGCSPDAIHEHDSGGSDGTTTGDITTTGTTSTPNTTGTTSTTSGVPTVAFSRPDAYSAAGLATPANDGDLSTTSVIESYAVVFDYQTADDLDGTNAQPQPFTDIFGGGFGVYATGHSSAIWWSTDGNPPVFVAQASLLHPIDGLTRVDINGTLGNLQQNREVGEVSTFNWQLTHLPATGAPIAVDSGSFTYTADAGGTATIVGDNEMNGTVTSFTGAGDRVALWVAHDMPDGSGHINLSDADVVYAFRP